MGIMFAGTRPFVSCCAAHVPERSHNAVASLDSIAVFGFMQNPSSTLNHIAR